MDECTIPPASSRSKLRSVMARFASSQNNASQFRQPLHDLHACIESSTAADLGALRCGTGLPLLVEVFARQRAEGNSTRLLGDVLQKLITHPTEHRANVEFFIRSGAIARVLEVAAEEMKTVRKQATTPTLTTCLTLIHAALDFLSNEGKAKPELQSYRHVLLDAVDALNLMSYALSLAMVALTEDMSALQASLAITRVFLLARQPKSADSASDNAATHDRLCHSLMTCIANMLIPGGQALKPEAAAISPAATGVLFLSLRLLNDTARRDLRLMQTMVADTATSVVFSHVVTAICTYIGARHTDFEALPPEAIPPDQCGPSKSFAASTRAGITWDRFPPIDHSAKKPPTFLRAAFHELLLLVGYVSVNNSAVQDVFGYGTETPLLRHVVNALPVSYFGVSKHIAFPSLIAVCFRHKRNVSVLSSEMDPEALVKFLGEEMICHAVSDEAPRAAPAVAMPVSWADMMDDDDDDIDALFASQTPLSVGGTSSEQVSAKNAEAVLAKGSTPYACFFRFDKRLATSLWAEARDDLTKALE
jgi:hypothetical protein